MTLYEYYHSELAEMKDEMELLYSEKKGKVKPGELKSVLLKAHEDYLKNSSFNTTPEEENIDILCRRTPDGIMARVAFGNNKIVATLCYDSIIDTVICNINRRESKLKPNPIS